MRITRSMAEDAATKMASKKFDEKIESLNNEKKVLGDTISKVCIPKEIIGISKKYPSFFNLYHSIDINPENGKGWSITLPTTEIVPNYNCKNFIVRDQDYIKAKSIIESIERLKSDKDNLTSRISNTLISLRTIDKITKEFPEAVPFLNASEKILPALKIDDLRNLFK